MSSLVAFDPSMHSTGFAIFRDEELVDAGELKVPQNVTGVDAIVQMWSKWHQLDYAQEVFDESVVEVQIWRGNQERLQPQQMMDLQAVCCSLLLSVQAEEIYWYNPRQWKGTIPKKPHQNQLRRGLPEQFKRIGSDALDAYGIGRFHLEKVKGGYRK